MMGGRQRTDIPKEGGDDSVTKKGLRKRWTPKSFAMFLLEFRPECVWLDPLAIKKKIKYLKLPPKKIEKLMNHPDFDEYIDKKFMVPTGKKKHLKGMFWEYLLRGYKQPQFSVKLLEVLGRKSGEYDPANKIDISGTITSEQKTVFEKTVRDAVLRARERDKLN